MKRLPLIIAIAGCALLSGACSRSWRDNHKAAGYADRLEQGETIAAEDYAEIVEFYCGAIDRGLAEMEPLNREHARAVDGGDHELAARTSKALSQKSAEIAAERKDLVRLGSHLYMRLDQMPDSVRARLINYLAGLNTRYSNF